ncbi:MAG: hypothetical protein ACRCSQ_02940 [Bacteroidales bacterium]
MTVNKKIRRGLFALLLPVLVLTACSTGRKGIPGSDRDQKGCIPSAGYTWSEVKKDCIRVFEQGIALKSTENPEATSVAYVVFSKDENKAELFLPDEAKHPVLEKKDDSWNHKDFRLEKENNRFLLFRDNRLIYANE